MVIKQVIGAIEMEEREIGELREKSENRGTGSKGKKEVRKIIGIFRLVPQDSDWGERSIQIVLILYHNMQHHCTDLQSHCV